MKTVYFRKESHGPRRAATPLLVMTSIRASVINCFTSLVGAARLIAKYRPPISVVNPQPQLMTELLIWTCYNVFEVE